MLAACWWTTYQSSSWKGEGLLVLDSACGADCLRCVFAVVSANCAAAWPCCIVAHVVRH